MHKCVGCGKELVRGYSYEDEYGAEVACSEKCAHEEFVRLGGSTEVFEVFWLYWDRFEVDKAVLDNA